MGADIHIMTERRSEGVWVGAGLGRHEYDGRNYALFAMLADVRNGSDFVPIVQPRGLPPDVSPQFQEEFECWEGHGHSHSHVTLAELLAYDWTQKAVRSGVLNLHTYVRWCRYAREQGESPEAWAGGVYGQDIVYIEQVDADRLFKESLAALQAKGRSRYATDFDEEEMIAEMLQRGSEQATGPLRLPAHVVRPDALVVLTEEPEPAPAPRVIKAENVHVNCDWPQFYYQCAGEFLSATIPHLLRVAHAECGGRYEDVRIVFFFDN